MTQITKANDKLIIEKQKLSALLEITNSVNKDYKVTDLLFQFENVMKDYIGITKLAFINNRINWRCILNYGVGENLYKFLIMKVYCNLKNTTFISDTHLEELEEFEILLPVFHKEKALSYLLIGGIGEKRHDWIYSKSCWFCSNYCQCCFSCN